MEALVFITLCSVVAAISGTLAARISISSRHKTERQPLVLSTSSQSLLSSRKVFRGNPQSPYTLLEFSDYECPPCKRTQSKVETLLKRYPEKLRLAVYHLPLKMHANAFSAAVAAEAAGEQGHFWKMHDALFAQNNLSEATIKDIAQKQGLNDVRFKRACQTSAKSLVLRDMQKAKDLSLNGTPSFLLCCPDGKVVRLFSYDQIEDYVR